MREFIKRKEAQKKVNTSADNRSSEEVRVRLTNDNRHVSLVSRSEPLFRDCPEKGSSAFAYNLSQTSVSSSVPPSFLTIPVDQESGASFETYPRMETDIIPLTPPSFPPIPVVQERGLFSEKSLKTENSQVSLKPSRSDNSQSPTLDFQGKGISIVPSFPPTVPVNQESVPLSEKSLKMEVESSTNEYLGTHFGVHGSWYGRDLLLNEDTQFDFGLELVRIGSPPTWPSSLDTRNSEERRGSFNVGKETIQKEFGTMVWESVRDLDLSVINKKIKEVEDKDRRKKLRVDFWVVSDLKAGVVNTHMKKEEKEQAVARIIDLLLEEEVDEVVKIRKEEREEWDTEPFDPILEE